MKLTKRNPNKDFFSPPHHSIYNIYNVYVI